MKYKDLYPNLKPIFEEANDPYANVIKGSQEKPCHWCEEPTEYVDIDYESHFCSQECLKNFEQKCHI